MTRRLVVPVSQEPEVTRGAASRGEPSTSLTIGRIAGIPVRLHWTFPALLLLVVLADEVDGVRAVLEGLGWVLALFACVVAHEIAHCLVARRHGATVRGIVLFPLGGMSQLESMPTAPVDEFKIAAIGPLTSICLGVSFAVVALMFGSRPWPPTLFAGPWLVRLAWLNVLLGGFNLLPAIPMDGGRMLRAALARRRSMVDATVLACRVAAWLALAMIVVGISYDIWLVLIGIFVLLGSRAEELAARTAVTQGAARTNTPRDHGGGPTPRTTAGGGSRAAGDRDAGVR